ncbi:endo alpha-1,4 polygalactosaminidase [Micromonospora sp. NBC_01699]|uniref:endo alpha-1,4 polygalactosaminidase n=1 Tax=Micromonospora sp. NBC_01699 TaxID=2975984 RepID=UPI002E37B061|nr:endo alpha-1,4 polygalactosaminidase [Micromonospora sp. NBC_01699]
MPGRAPGPRFRARQPAGTGPRAAHPPPIPTDGSRSGRAVLLLVVLAVLAGCVPQWARPLPIPPWPFGPTPTWQWQLRGEFDPNVDAEVFVLDAFRTPVEDVRRLRERDRRAVCHVNVGTYEPQRPDADRFPETLIGAPADVDGERWLDIRQWSALEPVITDRFRLCYGKGFTAVMPANMDGYARESGFPLTFDDQLVFNRRLAALARSQKLSPGLTNDLEQVVALEPYFDFAVNEECFQRAECDQLLPFVENRKPVFQVEYDALADDFCTAAQGYGFATIRKERDLGAWRELCPPVPPAR